MTPPLPEFDEEAFLWLVKDRADHAKPYLLEGARWQHAQTQALIALRDAEIERLRKLADSQIAYATRLEVNLKAAKTLDVLLSDNGQICEQYDEIDKLNAEITDLKRQLAEAKDSYEHLWKMRMQDEVERKK